MNIRKCVMFSVIVILFFSLTIVDNEESNVHAFTAQVIQRGATGDDVIELQSRLQYNGYYHGKIDGVYGWSTYWAVRNFQDAFGLEDVDGLVGEKTKAMLLRATKYNKQFVYDNLKKGNRFTHYGGVSWDIQSAPSQKVIEQARKQAEARKVEIETKYKANINEQKQPPQQGKTNESQEQQPKQNKPIQQDEKQRPGQQNNQQPAQQPNEQIKQPKEQVQQPTQQPEKPKTVPKKQAKVQQKQEEPKKQGAAAAVNMPGGFSQNDIQLLANAVYGEARGEPYIGQVAIAAVILNRINSPTFPDTISGVIFEPLAFTAVADGQIWLTPNEQAKKAVIDAINGWDPTGGATYYFNPETATSKWIWGRPQIKRIGKHIFCR